MNEQTNDFYDYYEDESSVMVAALDEYDGDVFSFETQAYEPNVPDYVRSQFRVPISSYGTEKEVMVNGNVLKEVYVGPMDVYSPPVDLIVDCGFEDFMAFSLSPLLSPDPVAFNNIVTKDTVVQVKTEIPDAVGKYIRYVLDHTIFAKYSNIVIIDPYPGTVSRVVKLSETRHDIIMLFTESYRKTQPYDECLARGSESHFIRFEQYSFTGEEVVYYHFRADWMFKQEITKVREHIGWELNPYSSHFNSKLISTHTVGDGVSYSYYYGHTSTRTYKYVPSYFRYDIDSSMTMVSSRQQFVYDSDLFHFCSNVFHSDMITESLSCSSYKTPIVPAFEVNEDVYKEYVYRGSVIKVYLDEKGSPIDCNLPFTVEQRRSLLMTIFDNVRVPDEESFGDLIGVPSTSGVNHLLKATLETFEEVNEYVFPGSVSFLTSVLPVWEVTRMQFIPSQGGGIYHYELRSGDRYEVVCETQSEKGSHGLVVGREYVFCCRKYQDLFHNHSDGIISSDGELYLLEDPYIYLVSGVSYVYSKTKIDRDHVVRHLVKRPGSSFGCPSNVMGTHFYQIAGLAFSLPPYIYSTVPGVVGKVYYTDARVPKRLYNVTGMEDNSLDFG